jgi:RNA polymerase sigma-70 factor, ECF subfamily
LHFTRNWHDAEDLVQETLMKAFKAYRNTAVDSHYRAWLLTIMRNTWISGHRVAARRPNEWLVADISDHEWEICARAPSKDCDSAEGNALRLAIDDDVRQAMLRLSPEIRITVYLVVIAGLKCRQAGDVMGVPTNTVLTRMHRA